jgi:MarR-like DNA-binding transcriptional regulator SgrR of sgrS sRNA
MSAPNLNKRVGMVLTGAIFLLGSGPAQISGPAGTDSSAHTAKRIRLAGAQQQAAPLRIGVVATGEFLPLPPPMLSHSSDAWVMEQVYGPGLIWSGTEYESRSLLALASDEVPAVMPASRIFFELREDVRYHDSSVLSLTSLLSTFSLYRRLAREGFVGLDAAFAHIDSIEITSEERRIGLWMESEVSRNARGEATLRHLATASSLPAATLRVIRSAAPDEVTGILATTPPVGLGGYRWVYRQPTAATAERTPMFELQAFADYFGGEPEFDRVEIHFFPTDRHLIQAFVTNQVDVARLPTWQASQTLRSQSLGSTVFRTYPKYDNFFFMAFNTSDGALRSAVVRRSMVLALDRASLPSGPRASGRLSDTPIDPVRGEESRGTPQRRRALNLLQTEAGFRLREGVLYDTAGRPLELTLIYPNHVEHYETMARQIQVDLGHIGFLITPQPLAPQELRQRLSNGDYQLALSEMTLHPSTAELYRLFHSDGVEQGFNFTRYRSRTFDSLISAVLRGQDSPGQNFLDQALRQLRLDYPLVPLYFPRWDYYAFNTDVVDSESVGRTLSRLEAIAHWKRKER